MQNPPKIFGTEHIIYIVLSFAVTIAILTVVGIFCKTEKLKKIVIKTGGGNSSIFNLTKQSFLHSTLD